MDIFFLYVNQSHLDQDWKTFSNNVMDYLEDAGMALPMKLPGTRVSLMITGSDQDILALKLKFPGLNIQKVSTNA